MSTVETKYITEIIKSSHAYVCINDNDYSVTIDTSDDDAMGDFERELSRAYSELDKVRELLAEAEENYRVIADAVVDYLDCPDDDNYGEAGCAALGIEHAGELLQAIYTDFKDSCRHDDLAEQVYYARRKWHE